MNDPVPFPTVPVVNTLEAEEFSPPELAIDYSDLFLDLEDTCTR